ncbi:MAG TPA: DUF58 domain-containing protein [Acidimicrobiales bacterium]|jgi:uncharacterized protein (DUF58 family)|nr:DUF58 domain-containing protein [Acidimicrobiales bacterium]
MTWPRPALSRPAFVLLGMGAAMFAIARTSGAGWVMVVLSGLVATLVLATLWPGLSLMTARVSAVTARDGIAGRPLSVRLAVDGWGQHLMARVLSPSGKWVRVVVPSAGDTSVVPERRGVVREVVVELRGGGPLGLVWWTRRARLTLEHPIEVGPVPDEPARLPIAGAGGAGGDPRGGAGLDVVRGMREYVPGDPARLVHWPTSARHGSLVVKELDDPASRRLAIVVDLRGPADAAEAAASRAAGLANRALREGLVVVMATAEDGGGRVTAAKTRLDVSRRLARAVASAPPDGPFPHGAEIVRVMPT